MKPGWGVPVAAWAASRALVLALALVGSLVLGIPTRGVEPQVPDALALLGGWDTTWYLDIALRGYDHDLGQLAEVYSNLAFFPLLPGLMAAGHAVGLNPFAVGVVAGNLGFLGALLALHALARPRLGERGAALATWAVALAPPAITVSLAYTEGLALALAAAAALAAVRGRFALAGLAAAGAALARPPGVLVALLVGLLALWDPSSRRYRLTAPASGGRPSRSCRASRRSPASSSGCGPRAGRRPCRSRPRAPGTAAARSSACSPRRRPSSRPAGATW